MELFEFSKYIASVYRQSKKMTLNKKNHRTRCPGDSKRFSHVYSGSPWIDATTNCQQYDD